MLDPESPGEPVRRVTSTLEPALADALTARAAALGVPLKILLLAAHLRVLAQFAPDGRVSTGYVVNVRSELDGASAAVGLYLNTVPMTLDVPAGSWLDLVRAVQAEDVAILAHRGVPSLELKRRGGGPLPYVGGFNFVHFHVYDALLALPDVTVHEVDVFEQTDFPFLCQFTLNPARKSLELSLVGSRSELPDERAAMLARMHHVALMSIAPHARGRLDRGRAHVGRGETRTRCPPKAPPACPRHRTSARTTRPPLVVAGRPSGPTRSCSPNCGPKCSRLRPGPSVGRDDNFFASGGDSIVAARLAARIRASFGVSVGLQALFTRPTFAAVAADIARQRRDGVSDTSAPDPACAAPPGCARERRRKTAVIDEHPVHGADASAVLFALSAGQRRLWLAEQIESGPAYHVALALDITGPLDRGALRSALLELIARHEALRTSIAIVDGEPHQAIRAEYRPELHVEPVNERDLQARLEELAAQPFDLTAGPPLRTYLLTWGPDAATMLLVLHHVLCDGWSVGLMETELRLLYAQAVGAGPGPGEAPALHYADYSEWLREHPDRPEDVEHWDERFASMPPPLDVRTIAEPAASGAGRSASRELSPELMAAAGTFARSHGTSSFFVLLAAYALLLARRARVEDVTVAVPVANRTHVEFERTVGFFVNTLAMRLEVPLNAPLTEVVRSIQQRGLDDLDHQGYAYEKVIARARRRHGEAVTELANVMFAYQNAPLAVEPWPGLAIAPRQVENGGAKFDLVLRVDPQPDGGALATLEYRASHFRPADADALLEGFARIVAAMSQTPACPANLVQLLPESARMEAIALGDGDGAVASRPNDVVSWFADVAHRESSRVAVVCGDVELTYGELNRRSAALAQHLTALEIGAEVRVGLACERGVDLVVGILGILRAGGAYVPLDPTYPSSRLSYIVKDSGVHLVIADHAGAAALGPVDVQIVRLDTMPAPDIAAIVKDPVQWLEPSIDPEQAAYVIYTSGSTGAPKGCVVSHRNVTRLMAACEGWLEPSASDVWTLFHSYAFDFSVWELWGALLYGGRLVVVPAVACARSGSVLERARVARRDDSQSNAVGIPSARCR